VNVSDYYHVQSDQIVCKAAIAPVIALHAHTVSCPSAIVTPALGRASIFLQIPEALAGGGKTTIKLWENTPPTIKDQKRFSATPLWCANRVLCQQ
jgi:hypothetical protein